MRAAEILFLIVILFRFALYMSSDPPPETPTNEDEALGNNTICGTKVNFNIYDLKSCYTHPKGFYLNESNSNVEECCLGLNPTKYLPSICYPGNLHENGTVFRYNNTNYTKICSPFDVEKFEKDNLDKFNQELVPCGVDTEITTSNDCFKLGNQTNYCCHVYGYVSGVNVNQCYNFDKLMGRAGVFISKGLTFYCNCIISHFSIFILTISIGALLS